MVSSTRILTMLFAEAKLVAKSASSPQERMKRVRDMYASFRRMVARLRYFETVCFAAMSRLSACAVASAGCKARARSTSLACLLRRYVALERLRGRIGGLQGQSAVHLAGCRLQLALLQVKPCQHQQAVNVGLQADRSLRFRPRIREIALLFQKNRQLRVSHGIVMVGADRSAEFTLCLGRHVPRQ